MSDLKWRDIAHYYAKSRIQIQLLRGSNPKKGELVNVADMLYVLFEADKAHKDQYFSHVSFEWSKPILRHLEDMTEADYRELYKFVYGEYVDVAIKDCWGTYREYFTFTRDCRGMVMTELSDKLGNSRARHWFYQNGFDLDDLIERGEAIRKEATNAG